MLPDLTAPRLYATTVPLDDPGPLLDLLPRDDGYAWLRHGEGMVAWGEVARHKAASIADADQWWTELEANTEQDSSLPDAPAGAGLVAFGSFVFDESNTSAQSGLVVPETVVGVRNGRAWLTRIGSEPGTADAPTPSDPPEPPRQLRVLDDPARARAWQDAVAEAVRRIGAGDLEKVVLARDLLAVAKADLDPRWLVRRLAERYARCWTYAIDGLVGSSPEMLLRQEARLATSRVLAGTIRRTGSDQQDLALAAALAQSSKDLEEHEYAVRSVARALAPYCSGMNVPDAPYVLDLPNVLHLATDVTAVADHGASSLALAAALHPSAAVCGTPTAEARAVIAELEQMDRGRYAGPVGWIDGNGDGEWAIALRCGQVDDADSRRIRLFAGCGIVAGSDPDAELAEAAAKFLPMRDALGS